MKAFLLAGLLASASLAAHAQTYYLDLTNQTLSVPCRAVAVEQVVDGRTGHQPISIVYRGLGSKSAAVAFRQGLETELTTFVQAQLSARPTDHAIVLCLRSLHIGETMGGAKEQATAEITADVYAHLPDGYHFVRSVGAHASAYGYETTGRHPGHLAQSLSQLDSFDWTAAPSQPARTRAELPTDAPAILAAAGRRGVAILREAPRRGLYQQFEQFLTNRPDTLTAFVVGTVRRRNRSKRAALQWRNVVQVRPLAPNGTAGRAVPTGLWGFSDGQQLYVRYDKQFFPLMRQGGFFTFVGEAPDDPQYAKAAAQAQMRANVVGVGFVGAVVDHSAEPTAYALDLRTGVVGPYPSLYAPARLDTAYLYIYRSAQATGPEPIKVSVDGRQIGSLRPGQYLELPWFRFGKPLELCLGDWPVAKPCQYLVPNTAQLNYLKINAATSPQPWQWMPSAQGAADLDELDKRAK